MGWYKNRETDAELRVIFERVRTDLDGLQWLRTELKPRPGIAAKQLLDEVEHAIRVEEEERRRGLGNKPAPTPVVVPPPAPKAAPVPVQVPTPISKPAPSVSQPVVAPSVTHADPIPAPRATPSPPRQVPKRVINESLEESVAREKLEELRRHLLDISGRSRLINFRHTQTSGRSIRIVDAPAALLLNNLMEKRKVELIPVPDLSEELPDEKNHVFRQAFERGLMIDAAYLKAESDVKETSEDDGDARLSKARQDLRDRVRKQLGLPVRTTVVRSIEEHARSLGICTDEELKTQHENRKHPRPPGCWQTLLSAQQLITKLGGIAKQADETSRELGIETLHVIFGFLQWCVKDYNGVEEIVLSPLLLQPVEILKQPKSKSGPTTPKQLTERAGATPSTPREAWWLTAENSDDISLNASLRERLQADYGFTLPEWDSDNPDLEAYWERVSEAIRGLGNWKVKRFVTVSHLAFSRVAMWHDLDLDAAGRTPANRHPLILDLFGGRKQSQIPSSEAFGEGKPQRPILLLDADASQQSAIVEALKGRNLVIQGPPGTGKSQTIANLIAAALHRGKTVLFVAEKQAALEAVSKRLREQARLGDFLMELHSVKELHSDKVRKRAVLDSLKSRLQLDEKPVLNRNVVHARIRHEETETQLNAYAKVMGEEFGGLGFSLHDILWSHLRLASSKAPRSLDRVEIPDVLEWTMHDLERRRKLMRDWVTVRQQRVREETGGEYKHPWGWVEESDAFVAERAQILESTRDLSESMDRVDMFFKTHKLWAQPLGLCAAEDLIAEVTALGPRPHPEAAELWNLAAAPDSRQRLERLCAGLALLQQHQRNLDRTAPGLLGDADALFRLKLCEEAWRLLTPWYRSDSTAELRGRLGQGRQVRAHLRSTAGILQRLRENHRLPVEPIGVEELESIAGFVDVVAKTPLAAVGRTMRLDGPQIAEELRAAAVRLQALQSSRAAILSETSFPVESLTAAEVDAHLDTLRRNGPISWLFNAKYRAARALLSRIEPTRGMYLYQRIELLSRIRVFLVEWERFQTDPIRERIGDYVTALGFSPDHLIQLADWIELLRLRTPLRLKLNQTLRTSALELQANHVEFAQELVQGGFAMAVKQICEVVKNSRTPFESLDHDLEIEEAGIGRILPWLEQWGCNQDICEEMFDRLRRSITEHGVARKALEPERGLLDALGTDIEAGLGRCEQIRAARERVSGLAVDSKWKERLMDPQGGAAWGELQARAAEVARHLAHLRQMLDGLKKAAKLGAATMEKWTQLPLSQVRNTLVRSLMREQTLETQCQWLALQARMKTEALALLLSGLEELPQDPEQAAAWLDRVVFRNLCYKAFQDIPQLARFRHSSPDELRREFATLDRELKTHDRTELVYTLLQRQPPTGYAEGRIADRTEKALLEHVTGVAGNRIKVRDLLRRAPKAILELKPCFLMSPLSVAQLIDRNVLTFDLVIFDEASQVKPEDAISALLRGRQFVVVGDPMQLPPTSFLQRTVATVEDESGDGGGEESILDLAEAAHGVGVMLRWHYRSKDPALIAFSNREFYENKLKVFPAPRSEHPDTGVHYVPVPGGVYSERRNPVEARLLAESVIEYMEVHPKRSIGIAALNREQSDLIEFELDQLIAKHPHARAYQEAMDAGPEPLFVKNLESVQGDERDTIFISTVFGESPDGRFSHQFGPIAGRNGHRRLNVLFTRAKYQLFVFSSIPMAKFNTSQAKNRGLPVLKEYLEYAQTRRLPRLLGESSPAESPFEEAVLQALETHGFKCETQWKVHGFRIDLVVRHPQFPELLVLGVECDGAEYHNSRSARERDRLRQEVLESLGWRLHRIWSTDWFTNPEKELRRLVEAVQAAIRATTRERAARRLSFLPPDPIKPTE